MAKNSCELVPLIDGKPSKAYNELMSILHNKPLVNYLYADYISSDMAEKMTEKLKPDGNPKYIKNNQGEYRGRDILDFLDYYKWEKVTSLDTLEKQLGAVDDNNVRVDYADAEEALQKASDFNDKHKRFVATVIQHSDVYNILVAEKNARTLSYDLDVKIKLKAWDVYKQVFNAANIDLNALQKQFGSVFSAFNDSLVNTLQNLQMMQMPHLNERAALMLFYTNQDSAEVQRLIKSFGSIEDAAQALNNFNHKLITLPSNQELLLKRAVAKCQKFNNIDLPALANQINEITQNLADSSSVKTIQDALHKLDKLYKINKEEIILTGKKIESLSEAAAETAIVLNRQIKKLEKERGNNAEGRALERTLSQLMRELRNKKYYAGLLNVLETVVEQNKQIETLLKEAPQEGTDIANTFKMAKNLQKIKEIRNQYSSIVEALASPNIKIDESIEKEDIENIRTLATNIKNFYDAKDRVIDNLVNSTMESILRHIIGNKTPDGRDISNCITMGAADSSIFNWLQSMGKVSDPVLNSMGSIIRTAQLERDGIINELSRRIRQANHKLLKAGFNSEFMYENSRYIISDIDWASYNKARSAYIKAMVKQGLRGFELKAALEEWEDANTEDRLVDTKNERTERVPDKNFRKPFPKLEEAQQEYYDTMMQIKGEIGSLLPAYAQKQYWAPQIRRNSLDALEKAQNIKDVGTIIKNRLKDLVTVREDDEYNQESGIINGETYEIVDAASDDTPLKQIPIFFINKLKDEKELLKDFSTGLTRLAGTAINYNAMNNIADIVEFVGDFAKDRMAVDNGKAKTETVEDTSKTSNIRIFKILKSYKNNAITESLVNGFIDQHIYGKKLAPNDRLYKFSKPIRTLIGYTSFKGLATNLKGMISNYIVGEFQMFIEAGAGEFYNFKDFLEAHLKLFGKSGVYGEITDLLTNNINSKSVLLRELFDPLSENFAEKSNTRYYNSMFRQIMSKDCSFIGYASGEFLIHYVNMYAILLHQKVLLDRKQISLYDAFEVANKKDGNSKLKIKEGVTTLEGEPITDINNAFIQSIRRTIKYVNDSTHGAMNEEDKGIIHRYLMGRAIMNFRQWMIGHYSRRFKTRYHDSFLNQDREGYWVSVLKLLASEDTKDEWERANKTDAILLFMKDLFFFATRAQAQWANLDDMQKANVRRVLTEISGYIGLICLSFALGAPDDHKGEFWRRMWIYQVKRLMMETRASTPIGMFTESLKMINSPMASLDTLNGFLYIFMGIGDINKTLKSGPNKGENKYWRNIKKYSLPFFKDYEQLQRLDEDNALFMVFDTTPSNY